MYRTFLILLILISSLPAYSQGNWTNYPTPAFRLFDMDFRTRDLGIAVDTDSILLTKDGGVTWKKSYFPGPYPFNCKIDLINNDQDTVYFFTDFSGKIYKGLGFNDSAQVIFNPPNTSIRWLDAHYQNGECYFVGDGGGHAHSMHMTNYGANFSYHEHLGLIGLYEVTSFFDGELLSYGRSQTGDRHIYKSVNSASSFFEVDSASEKTRNVNCKSDTCMVVSDQENFRVTFDRGNNWSIIQNTSFMGDPSSTIWLGYDHVYSNLLTGEHLIFSKDGGYTWQYDSIGSNDVMRKIQYVEGVLFLLHDHSLRKREFSGIGVPEVDIDPINVEILVDRKNTSLSISNKENTTLRFAIYSLMGQLLFEGEIAESEHLLNYSSRLSNKIGILRVQTGNRVGSRKFVF